MCVCVCVYVCVCVCVCDCLIGNNGKLQYLRFLFAERYVNVAFMIRCLYSAGNFTLVRE